MPRVRPILRFYGRVIFVHDISMPSSLRTGDFDQCRGFHGQGTNKTTKKISLVPSKLRIMSTSSAISQQNIHLTRKEPKSKWQTQKTSWWSSSIFESVSERSEALRALRPGAHDRALEMCLCIPPSPKTLKSMSFAEEGLKGTCAEGSQQCRGSAAEGS